MKKNNATTKKTIESESFPPSDSASEQNSQEQVRESAETIENLEPKEREVSQVGQSEEKDTAVAEEEVESSVQSVDGTQIEQIVRKVVEEKLTMVFGKPKEPPRKNALAEELSSEDHLRLGYGARSPHI